MPLDAKRRINQSRVSLEGLAVGDAFGQTFFAESMQQLDPAVAMADGPWPWTDDTAMALSIYLTLERHGTIVQDELAGEFAARFINDRDRGYGAGMHRLLFNLSNGHPWRTESIKQFKGQGSWGNGGAMRVAPLGAYFSENIDVVVEQAKLSAEVTHAHEEGIAGTIAVAVAAALASRINGTGQSVNPTEFLREIAARTPDSITRDEILRAVLLPLSSGVRHAAETLGSGGELSAQDTVPFALWCAAQHLDDFARALRFTVSGGGDVDTTCAIVGGIVALSAGLKSIPEEWLQRREALPQWVYIDLD